MKTAVVTGGARDRSRHRAGCARRLPGGHHRPATRPTTTCVTADVTDRAQVDAALDAIRAQIGPVTMLVNAAGLDGSSDSPTSAFEEWQGSSTSTSTACSTAFGGPARHGRRRLGTDREHLLVEHPFRCAVHGAYVAAKSAVNGLTKSLAMEYGPDGITVNAVPPGFIDTPMLRSAERSGIAGRPREDHRATPVRRMGRPEDIAAACAFLISEEAGYITGQISASTAAGIRNGLSCSILKTQRVIRVPGQDDGYLVG